MGNSFKSIFICLSNYEFTMTSQPSIRELIADCHYSCCGGDYCETSQEDRENDLNKTLFEIRKRIEGLKKHPEMSDALAPDNLMHEYGYDKAIDEVLGLFK